MPTFGEVIVHIIITIISSIIDTTVSLASDVALLFQIIAANAGVVPPFVIVAASVVLAVVILALFRMVRGDVKHLIAAVALLVILILVSLFAVRQ